MDRLGSFIASFTLSHLHLDPPKLDPVRGRSPRIDVGLEKFGFHFRHLGLDPSEIDPIRGRPLRIDVGLE